MARFAHRRCDGDRAPLDVARTIASKGKANLLVALLLWMLCIVPMIVYVVSASKDVVRPFAIRMEPAASGVYAHATGDAQSAGVAAGVLARLGAAA